jgi:periplasmic divalent cation tolerance protein
MALVYCPCPNLDEAKRLGNALLDARLAGCINILPGMVSLYDWQGARETSDEVVLIAKTRAGGAAVVRGFLEREHPYDVPAILTIGLDDVNAPYRDWLDERMG